MIRAALTGITTQYIDRRQIAELFGVSSYQAGQLIRDMGPMLHGNSMVVDADDVCKLLSEAERDREIRDLRNRLITTGEIKPVHRGPGTRQRLP